MRLKLKAGSSLDLYDVAILANLHADRALQAFARRLTARKTPRPDSCTTGGDR